MRIQFTPEALDDPSTWDSLDRIFFLFMDGLHYWEIPNEDEVAESKWFKDGVGSHAQLRKAEAFKKAVTDAAYPKDHRRILKVAAKATAPDEVPHEIAVQLSRFPLTIILENSENDAAFLQIMAKLYDHAWLANGIKENRIQWGHAGGIAGVVPLLTQLLGRGHPKTRIFVLIDSDSRFPGDAKPDPTNVTAHCKGTEVPHHMLSLRAIENYIPATIVSKVCEPKQWEVLSILNATQADHYHFKSGFKNDLHGHDEFTNKSQGDLYANLVRKQIQAIKMGVKGIEKVYKQLTGEFTKQDIEKRCESNPKELRTLLEAIQMLL